MYCKTVCFVCAHAGKCDLQSILHAMETTGEILFGEFRIHSPSKRQFSVFKGCKHLPICVNYSDSILLPHMMV